LAAYPAWVLDYVVVHELAHLLVESHGPAHDALVERYPYAERARGFLIALDLDPYDGDDPSQAPLTAADVRP
jgi:predicted metal-dependent hydrolase